jgi:hypothetical protein
VSRDLERTVKRARKRFAEDYNSLEALAALHDAERQLAAARHQAWAEPLDLGVRWDTGAPLPQLVSICHKAVLICRAAVDDPNWDGTYATVVSPNDQAPGDLLEFEFSRCHAVKFGGPNGEALNGHPLYGREPAAWHAHALMRCAELPMSGVSVR